MSDFRADLPVKDVSLGRTGSIRVYGFADVEPRLVEVRITDPVRAAIGAPERVLNLTVEQARDLAAGLTAAAERAAA